jgi:hypothetical protein
MLISLSLSLSLSTLAYITYVIYRESRREIHVMGRLLREKNMKDRNSFPKVRSLGSRLLYGITICSCNGGRTQERMKSKWFVKIKFFIL